MTEIYLETFIAASREVCFNASRDVGLHLGSAAHTRERVVAGRNAGLCTLGDEITWEARHFGIKQQLSVKITELDFPRFFADRMTRGAFKSMRHEHYYEAVPGGTKMTDRFMYETPFWIFGRIFDSVLLKRHMTEFLSIRNRFLKEFCEKQPTT
jgi:ligand-binding SRPBCC domain-containing protein